MTDKRGTDGPAAARAADGSQRTGAHRSGFTLVEITVVLVLVAIGLAGFVQAIARSSLTAETTRQNALATRTAQATVEDLKGFDFATVFASFNPDPLDDPAGAGTAPGAAFAVPGLDPVPGDPDGLVGEILFPIAIGAPGALREDVLLPDLGMPRDLSGDAVMDANDHSGDYRILPVMVRLTWRGPTGTSRVQFKTILSDF